MFPSASPRGTLRVSGKQNSLFPLGPVIKCLMFLMADGNGFHCVGAAAGKSSGTKRCVMKFGRVYV